ncbi:MAG: T9SS type A sorting domain-containing protein [Bacteroidales bacterium]
MSHLSGGTDEGLMILTRVNKGSGDWNETIFPGPDGCETILWPRIATGGVDHSVIHMLALTPLNVLYQGMEGALLYSQSTDGGATWVQQNVILEGMTSNEYTGIAGDTYEIQAQDNNVAILVGDPWCDLMLFKSTDGGDNWVKTIIWEHPYPMWNGTPTDTFYCADGAHHFAFDPDGMVHVVFGINRALSVDGTAQFWFPGVGGIGYWNEDRPTFSNNINALCPYANCPDSELIDDYSLIGWTQDINNNGEIDVLDDWGTYYLGFSSMPQIHIDHNSRICVAFSSVTEIYDNGIQNYRHLWVRFSSDGDFWEPFYDLSPDPLHPFNEFVFPSVATWSDNDFYLVYQYDHEPGLAVKGDEDPYIENTIRFMKVPILGVSIEENEFPNPNVDADVLQNVPNPFNDKTTIGVNVRKATNLTLEVANVMGQKVKTIDVGFVLPGMNKIEVDGSTLNPGLYFYTVKAGSSAITRKMIVE